jgi:hypothetical protein
MKPPPASSLLTIVGVLLLAYGLSTFSRPVQAQWCNDPLMCTISVTQWGCDSGCFADDRRCYSHNCCYYEKGTCVTYPFEQEVFRQCFLGACCPGGDCEVGY